METQTHSFDDGTRKFCNLEIIKNNLECSRYKFGVKAIEKCDVVIKYGLFTSSYMGTMKVNHNYWRYDIFRVYFMISL